MTRPGPNPTPRVRVQISISSPEALEAIDARARAADLNRSAYLERCALADDVVGEIERLKARLRELAS